MPRFLRRRATRSHDEGLVPQSDRLAKPLYQVSLITTDRPAISLQKNALDSVLNPQMSVYDEWLMSRQEIHDMRLAHSRLSGECQLN
jgi:hypothetical protein